MLILNMTCPDSTEDTDHEVEVSLNGMGMGDWACPCGEWHDIEVDTL
jgi:hypothetical protein